MTKYNRLDYILQIHIFFIPINILFLFPIENKSQYYIHIFNKKKSKSYERTIENNERI